MKLSLMGIATSQIFNIILFCVIGAILVIAIVLEVVKFVKKKKITTEQKTREVEGVVEQRNVRYSQDKTVVDEKGQMNISLTESDIVLQPRKKMIVSKKGPLLPGKYTMLGSVKGEDKFNVRIGLYVKQYSHGDTIILVDGEEITAISTTVLLR